MKIALQAGHQNIKNNCNLNLRGSTGAPGEAEWTVKLRDALCAKLLSYGFIVTLFDANANCQSEAEQDFDLFLSLHYDADVYNTGGGFADFPDPAVDYSTKESQRICKKINEIYFPTTNIAYHPERSNGNTKFYYMWQSLTAKTPCVLIECGTNNKDNLPQRIEEVAEALTKSICAVYNTAYSSPQEVSMKRLQALFTAVKTILYGKGWPWQKISKLKQLMSP